MSEKFQGSDAEKKRLQEEDEERYAAWMKDHPETPVVPEALRECGPEIAELEAMLVSFESTYSLVDLLAITDLTPQEAPSHPIREPAKNALVPIVAKLNALKKETNIPDDKYEGLKARYKILSRAVGVINRGKVDHNR